MQRLYFIIVKNKISGTIANKSLQKNSPRPVGPTPSVCRVKSVSPGSCADEAGFKANDIIVSVDGAFIQDELDFSFHASKPFFLCETVRKGVSYTVPVERRHNELFGMSFFDPPLRHCRNKCLFCFVDQLPAGLRQSLYIKDEDVRHSFLNGNYITLSGIKQKELDRVALLGLSPLFISVHATDPDVRRRLLRNRFAGEINQQLSFLQKNSICFHTQIVVCPGINDGKVLIKTIQDLLKFKTGCLSVAVVPVGLSRYHRENLRLLSPEEAVHIVESVSVLSDIDMGKTGFRRLFCSDELFIKAQAPIPAAAYYVDYPQIENGVGLVRQLLVEWKKIQRNFRKDDALYSKLSKKRPQKIGIVTSHSAYSFIKKICSEITELCSNIELDVVAVTNHFFGESVTVAGLLSGKDTIAAIKTGKRNGWTSAIVPSVMFNTHGHTLDGLSLARICNAVDMPVKKAGSASELLARV
jgi:putative radical SAM enzyme (TIGR03279 family)